MNEEQQPQAPVDQQPNSGFTPPVAPPAPAFPPAPQPVNQYMATPQNQPPAVAPSGNDPGKNLAIVGIVLAFFFQILGLILSIAAHNKSKKAGFKNTLATVGIVLNSVFLALSLILIPILFSIVMVASSGVQDRAISASAANTASTIVMKAEAYNTMNGSYPTSVAQFNSADESNIDSIGSSDWFLATEPMTEATAQTKSGSATAYGIELYECGATGNKVGSWDASSTSVQYVYAGDSTESSTCTLIY